MPSPDKPVYQDRVTYLAEDCHAPVWLYHYGVAAPLSFPTPGHPAAGTPSVGTGLSNTSAVGRGWSLRVVGHHIPRIGALQTSPSIVTRHWGSVQP